MELINLNPDNHAVNSSLFVRVKELFELDKLQSQRIVVIGLGATGSKIVRTLSLLGIPITAVDYDTVSISNVLTQVYRESDVDVPKTKALADMLETRNSYRLDTMNLRVSAQNIHQLNIDENTPIILAIDSVDATKELLSFFLRKEFKYILYPGLPMNVTDIFLAEGIVRVVTKTNIERMLLSLGDDTDESLMNELIKELKGCAVQQLNILSDIVAAYTAQLVLTIWCAEQRQMPIKIQESYIVSGCLPLVRSSQI